MKKILFVICAIAISTILVAEEKTKNECFIGSSMFLLGNLLTDEPPMYGQLNFGYELTDKDVLIAEAITWAYYKPLGIPYGSSGDSYPGKIRAFGIGIGYQRFIWKKLYATVQATPFTQYFYDADDNKIAEGFQLWLQLRMGYRIEMFNKLFFVEPSVVCNYWPINTNFPDSFKKVESGWPNYFLFEPGLHFGFRF